MVDWLNTTTAFPALLFPYLSKPENWSRGGLIVCNWWHDSSVAYGIFEGKAPFPQILGRREIPEVTHPSQYTVVVKDRKLPQRNPDIGEKENGCRMDKKQQVPRTVSIYMLILSISRYFYRFQIHQFLVFILVNLKGLDWFWFVLLGQPFPSQGCFNCSFLNLPKVLLSPYWAVAIRAA